MEVVIISESGVLENPGAPAVGATTMPRLAEGLELIGPYQGSGYREPKYIVSRADGQVIQLPHPLYALVSHLDGQRDLTQLATRLSTELETDITAEQISFLVEQKLRPAGIVAVAPGDSDDAQPVKRRPDALLLLRYRVPVLPARAVGLIAAIFRPLYWPPVVLAALAAFVATDVWIVLAGGLGQVVPAATALIYQPALTLLVLGSIFVSGMFHECGHVAACRYGGARPGAIGVGIYLVWPAMYSTVTDSYRLSRVGRLRTDLGGIYFNLIFMVGMSLVYLQTGVPWLLVALVLMHVETAWQFLPNIRLDGYYILADLVGVPDLFSLIGPVLKSLLPGRPTHPRVAELKPWTRRVMTLWVVLVVPVLAYFLIWFLIIAPLVLPVVWDSLQALAGNAAAAVRAGQSAAATLGIVQIFLLLLPWIGITLILISLGRRIWHGAVSWLQRSRTGDETADTPSAWSRMLAGSARPTKWLLAAALPVAALGAVAMNAISRRVATAGEAGITAAASAAGRGDPGAILSLPDPIAVHQIAVLQALWSGAEPAALIDVTRAMFLVVGLVGCLLLWPVARRLGLSMPAAAAAVLLCGLPAPLVMLHASVDAGALAVVWLTLAVAVAGRGRAANVGAIAAAAIGVLTAPLAATALLAAGAATMLFSVRRYARGAVVLGTAMAGGAVVVAALSTGGRAWTVSGGAPVPTVVLAGVLAVGALVAGLAWRRRELRPPAAAAVALLVCAGLSGDHRSTALLLVAPVLAVLAAAQLGELGERFRGWRARVALAVVAALVLVTAVPAVVAAGAPPAPLDSKRLSSWVRSELPGDAMLLVDPLTREQLLREGIAADQLVTDVGEVRAAPPGALTVISHRPGAEAHPSRPEAARLLMTFTDEPGGAVTSVYAAE